MKSDNDKPLVTFALITYNQEKYIREAVAGALAQTYTPLQIIISDDCSTDRTYEIASEMVSVYSGPHQILLNRNEKNIGIGAQYNRIMELAQGDLIVNAAGDDISIPERTAILVEAWVGSGKAPISIHSAVIYMDQQGENCRVFRTPMADRVSPYALMMDVIIGATHAWTRKVFDVFGPLNENIVLEDKAIGFRSALLGGVVFIDQPLVKYREGGLTCHVSMAKPQTLDSVRVDYGRMYWTSWQHRSDLEKIHNTPLALKRFVEKRMIDYKVNYDFLSGDNPYLILWKSRKQLTFFALRRSMRYLFPRFNALYQKTKRAGSAFWSSMCTLKLRKK